MRQIFIHTLVELAQHNPQLLLLTGDLGYSVVEPFAKRLPKQFINMGVAEQNMLGVATGLAEAGFIPFVYSITPFAVLRSFEWIRNGPVYHQLPVRIIGIGQGVEYGLNGLSHFALEDIGVLRTQPGLHIIAPADDAQAQAALLQTWNLPGPVYFRLSKESTNIPALGGRFDVKRVECIRKGADVLIVSSGAITETALLAADLLAQQGIQAAVLVVACIAPPPSAELAGALTGYGQVFSLEAHYITGGLGSLLAEIIAEQRLNSQLTRLGFTDIPRKTLGSAAFLQTANGLAATEIAAQIQKVLQNA